MEDLTLLPKISLSSLETYSHHKLVEIAFNWCKTRYGVVVMERSEKWGEIPDVVGMNLSDSILIECKVSRSDFMRDRKKFSRVNGGMVGNYRVYCCPKGLLKETDLPEGWGLLEVYPSGFARLKKNIFTHRGYHHPLCSDGYKGERHLLYAVLRDKDNPDLNHKIFLQANTNY